MSKIIKTDEDGWDCVPELKKVAKSVDNMANSLYEIRHCVRATKLQYLVENLKDSMEAAIEELEYIDTDVEYETINDY